MLCCSIWYLLTFSIAHTTIDEKSPIHVCVCARLVSSQYNAHTTIEDGKRQTQRECTIKIKYIIRIASFQWTTIILFLFFSATNDLSWKQH